MRALRPLRNSASPLAACSHHGQPLSVTRQAFTLAELLVVIGILSIILTLVISAVAAARSYALRIACVSNLRQVGISLMFFADEHHGIYPLEGNKGDDDPTTSMAWFYQLPPYLDQRDVTNPNTVFQCPVFYFGGSTIFNDASPKSYKYNAWLDNNGRRERYVQGSARDESRIVGFFDAIGGDTGLGQHGHGTPNAVDFERHNGVVNIIYLDGHTSSSERGDENTDWSEKLQWLDSRWKP